jgi:hypothetical protein
MIQELPITSVQFSTLKSLLRGRWLFILLVALTFALFWLNLFSLPATPVTPQLDSSWCGALIHFSAQGLQFGRDIAFTHGPLGHLTAFVYTGELFSVRVVWEFISKTLIAAILCTTMLRLPVLWRLPFFFFVILFIWADGVPDALYFLVICCLTALLFSQGRFSTALNIIAGVFFAIISLIKFTYLLLAILALALVLASYFRQQKSRRALLLGLAFVIAFVCCWGIAGQHFANLFAYLATSMDVAFGYKEAMGLPAAHPTIVAAGIAAALLGLTQCALLFLDSPRFPVLLVALFFAGETFLSWNRAFIRADDHVLSFFALCPPALLTMWTVARPKRKVGYAGYAINLLVLATCLWGISLQRPMALGTCIGDVIRRSQGTWSIVRDLRANTARLHAQLTEMKSAHALPRVRAEVGDHTIDVFGYEQGIALLNAFNYTPRPIFQGYSAYTPSLIKANTAFYSSSQAPDYVLLKYQTIDDRYPALDDAGVLRQLLYNYKPLFEEEGYLLWKKIMPAMPIPLLSTVTESLTFDSEFRLPPGKILWLQLDFTKSLRGWARNVFGKPPIVTLRVSDSLGQQTDYRLIPSMSSAGFLINPYLKTRRQVLRLSGGVQNASMVSFSVLRPGEKRGFFQRQILGRLTALPELPKTEMDEQARRMGDAASVDSEAIVQDRLITAFNASTEVLLRLNPTNRFQGISALNESHLTNAETGLRITATGTDPQLSLPRFSAGNQRMAIVRIDLEAPTSTGFQVFYLPFGVSIYGDHVINRFVRHGENTVYLALTDSQLGGGPLRLDPGMSAGDYFITSLEARAVSPESISDSQTPER